jgi:predicted PurR-regulated permease PerM
MFLVIQQIEGNVVYPKVVGGSVGLPGMWVLLAVALGGKLMGVAGMFIMIPVVSVVYALLREVTEKRLKLRQIDADKLKAHPPELRRRLKAPKKKKDKPAKKAK